MRENEHEGDLKRWHIYLSGRVQGVGMRATVADLAPDHGITGWVRNLSDGRVEIVAEGRSANLERFLATLESQMRGYIGDIQRSAEPATGEWKYFSVTH
ncbi:MAG: acylphosphatase [Planctomycetes bacterium]|nr:acylphosphatase [Planctomycetota bacterium]